MSLATSAHVCACACATRRDAREAANAEHGDALVDVEQQRLIVLACAVAVWYARPHARAHARTRLDDDERRIGDARDRRRDARERAIAGARHEHALGLVATAARHARQRRLLVDVVDVDVSGDGAREHGRFNNGAIETNEHSAIVARSERWRWLNDDRALVAGSQQRLRLEECCL